MRVFLPQSTNSELKGNNVSCHHRIIGTGFLLALAAIACIGGCSEQANSPTPLAKQEAVKQTPEQVFAATLKDAEAGDALVQTFLGAMYADGEGVAKDAAKAVEWYQKAAAQGVPPAQYGLGKAYYYGDGVAKDAAKAVEWWQKAAAHGQAEAQFNLGVMYADGEGVAKDAAKAVEWYQKAAAQGNAMAQYNLGGMYAKGEGVAKDAAKAVEWYQKAAAQGHARAQYNLGGMYANGEGVAKDAAKAVEWWQKAAAQGHARAQGNLGVMYAIGEGVSKDLVLAYAWANLSAANGDKLAVERRDVFETRLSLVEKAEAQRLSSGWKEGQILVREGKPATAGVPSGTPTKQGTGTAFLVSKTGQAITNHHVIDGCREVKVEGRDGAVKVVTSDTVNDLALLQIPGTTNATATVASDPTKLRQGEEIVAFGFPLNAVLSSGGNLTPGVVSALTGLGNNTNQMQITAPIQPGSSGSPVLNKKGEVVGVVSMKLSDAKMAKATGQIGQAVNFAVNGQTLKSFLDAHQVTYGTGGFFARDKSTADLADEARKWTLVVERWR